MSNVDWFRSEFWTPEIEVAFNDRLARSRGQRSEYLRIQALTLVETGKRENALAAIDLAKRQLELKGDSSSTAQMHAVIARARIMLADISAALDAFRRSVGAEFKRPNVRGYHYIEFAWFVATNRLVDHYDEALKAIEQNKEERDLAFPANQYRFFGALALISEDRGESLASQRLARNAIEAARRERGPFRHLPKLGLVRTKSDDVRRRLEQLANG